MTTIFNNTSGLVGWQPRSIQSNQPNPITSRLTAIASRTCPSPDEALESLYSSATNCLSFLGEKLSEVRSGFDELEGLWTELQALKNSSPRERYRGFLKLYGIAKAKLEQIRRTWSLAAGLITARIEINSLLRKVETIENGEAMSTGSEIPSMNNLKTRLLMLEELSSSLSGKKSLYKEELNSLEKKLKKFNSKCYLKFANIWLNGGKVKLFGSEKEIEIEPMRDEELFRLFLILENRLYITKETDPQLYSLFEGFKNETISSKDKLKLAMYLSEKYFFAEQASYLEESIGKENYETQELLTWMDIKNSGLIDDSKFYELGWPISTITDVRTSLREPPRDQFRSRFTENIGTRVIGKRLPDGLIEREEKYCVFGDLNIYPTTYASDTTQFLDENRSPLIAIGVLCSSKAFFIMKNVIKALLRK